MEFHSTTAPGPSQTPTGGLTDPVGFTQLVGSLEAREGSLVCPVMRALSDVEGFEGMRGRRVLARITAQEL